jgi:hypothetical protein
MDRFTDWKKRIAALDAALHPIANRPIMISVLRRLIQSHKFPHALDEAGVRMDMENLLAEVIDFYPGCDAATRESIRKLVDEHRSFLWASALSQPPTTENSFRDHLILFSIKDQERDTRDAILDLHSVCTTAASAGLKIEPILKEIAELSSDVNRYGMGSTRSLLLKTIPRS